MSVQRHISVPARLQELVDKARQAVIEEFAAETKEEEASMERVKAADADQTYFMIIEQMVASVLFDWDLTALRQYAQTVSAEQAGKKLPAIGPLRPAETAAHLGLSSAADAARLETLANKETFASARRSEDHSASASRSENRCLEEGVKLLARRRAVCETEREHLGRPFLWRFRRGTTRSEKINEPYYRRLEALVTHALARELPDVVNELSWFRDVLRPGQNRAHMRKYSISHNALSKRVHWLAIFKMQYDLLPRKSDHATQKMRRALTRAFEMLCGAIELTLVYRHALAAASVQHFGEAEAQTEKLHTTLKDWQNEIRQILVGASLW